MQQVLTVLLLATAVFDLWMVVFAITRQDRSRSVYFALLTMAMTIYSIGYLIELYAVTPEAAMTALRIEYFGIPFVAPLYFLTAMSLFRPSMLRDWMLPATLVYGMALFLTVFFNDAHGLYYTSVQMVTDGNSYFVSLGHGPLYYVQQVVAAVLMLIAYGIMVREYARITPSGRSQMLLLNIGATIGFCTNVLNVVGVLPMGIDPTPIGITLGLGFFAVALFKHRLLDIVSTAANNAIMTMDDAMIVFDNEWGYVTSNTSAKRLFPQLADLGANVHVSVIEDWPVEMCARGEAAKVNFQRLNEREGLVTYRAVIGPITDEKGRRLGWSIVIRDITDMTQLVNQLEELATTDSLTGIYNRRHFWALATRELSRAKRFGQETAMILFDLDFFKRINDEYGHLAGDHVLCSVVETVKMQLRPYDVFARYGGEEFIIFVTGGDAGHLDSFAERLRVAIEQSEIIYEGHRIPVTASFGVVVIPPGADLNEAVHAVDEAMYAAKQNGRNCVYTGSM